MRNVVRVLLSVGLLVAGAVGASAPTAATPTEGGFGIHVSTCARAEMLDGEHNPGLHQGVAGHHHDHEC